MASSKLSGFKSGRKSLDFYDQFLAKTSFDRIQKILARYELYKMSMDVPGHIVECGVFKGSGIYLFAKLQKIFAPNNERRIYGFDFFNVRPKTRITYAQDKKIVSDHKENWATQNEILDNLEIVGIDNVELIAGDVAKTTKEFANKNFGLKISLLYLDVDTYDGTLVCLKNLFPLVSNGGLVVFDEYAYASIGESKAVDEYFAKQKIELRSLPWANTPSAYLIK